MSTTPAADRFTALPDDQTLAATVVALEEHGSSVDVVDDFDAARETVLALIPEGSSVTAIGGQPEYALGSVHAVTRDGTLVIASASGSQLASYAWGAANVIFVVGAPRSRTGSGTSTSCCDRVGRGTGARRPCSSAESCTAAATTRRPCWRRWLDERDLLAHGQHRADRAAGRDRRVRGVPGDRGDMGASAHVSVLRPHRMLRQLAAQHASAHARSRGHPIARSAEPGENWSWCHVDSVAFVLTGP